MRALLKFESSLYFWRFLDQSVKLLHLANYFHLLHEEQWSSCLYRGVVQKGTVLFALSPAEQTHGSMCSWLRWRKAGQSKGLFSCEKRFGKQVCLFIKAQFVPLIADPTVILHKNPKAFAFYSSAIKPKSTCRTDSSFANMKTDDFLQRIPFWNI